MTDAVARKVDEHEPTDVYVFEVSGEIARDYSEDWSGLVRIKFETGNDGRLWLLVKQV